MLQDEFPHRPDLRYKLVGTQYNYVVLLSNWHPSPEKLREAEAILWTILPLSKQLVADFPTHAEYRHQLSQLQKLLCTVMTQNGNFEEGKPFWQLAIATLEELVREYPEVTMYRRNLADLHARWVGTASDSKFGAVAPPRELLKHAHRACDLDPHSPNCWYALGEAEYLDGQWERAIQAIHKSIVIRGNDRPIGEKLIMALACAHLKRMDEAKKWYRKVLPSIRNADVNRQFAEEAENTFGEMLIDPTPTHAARDPVPASTRGRCGRSFCRGKPID